MSEGREVLFSSHDLSRVMEVQEGEMRREIDAIEGKRLLNTSVEDLCDYFEEKYRLEVPRLKEEDITVADDEVVVDATEDPNRYISDRSRPFSISATRIAYHIPFEGDTELLKYRPSAFTDMPPRAMVGANEIVLTYTRTDHEAEKVKSEFERDMGEIRRWLGWIEKDVAPFNASLRNNAEDRILARREKLLKDQGLVAELGYPLRRREDAPQTYVAPVVRRKIPMPMPKAGTEPFVAEPTLEMQEYEHILSIIENMAKVIERSPKAFRGMKEEDLRHHFLVQLNGQYEGQATAETFNFEGKTDILIRVEGKNIFIAECRFWHSPTYFREVLDQLLGYATWRDTKTAVLVFNRRGSLSRVLARIPELVRQHARFKREVAMEGETRFRFVLGHRDDMNRELLLTVLVFEVPG